MKIIRWQPPPPHDDSDVDDTPATSPSTSIYGFDMLWEGDTVPLLSDRARSPHPGRDEVRSSRKSHHIDLSSIRGTLDGDDDDDDEDGGGYTSQVWDSDSSSGGARIVASPAETVRAMDTTSQIWHSDSEDGGAPLPRSEPDILPRGRHPTARAPRNESGSDSSSGGAPLGNSPKPNEPRRRNGRRRRRGSRPGRRGSFTRRSSGNTREETSPPPSSPRTATPTYPQKNDTPKLNLKKRRAFVLRPGEHFEIRRSPSSSSEYSTVSEDIHSVPPAWLEWLDSEIASLEAQSRNREEEVMEFFTHQAHLILRSYLTSLLSHPEAEGETDAVKRWRGEMAGWAAGILGRINGDWVGDERQWNRFWGRQDLLGFWWLVWGALLEVVVRMEYEGREMDGVVRLVGKLLEEGKEGRGVVVVGANGKTWTRHDIPGFKDLWSEAHLSIEAQWFTQSTPQQWISSVSFLGRLTGAGLANWWALGVQELDDALNGRRWRHNDPLLECYVLAAAEYVRHAGVVFVRACASGEYGLSLDFWDVWQLRFARVSEYLEAHVPAFRAAFRAQRVMEDIRGSVDLTELVMKRMDSVLRKQRHSETRGCGR